MTGVQTCALPISQRLSDIADKLSTPGGATGLTVEERAFIEGSSFPVLTLLQNASTQGTADAMVEILAEPVAFQTAHRMLNDLWDVTRFVIVKANQVQANQSHPDSAAGRYCSVEFLKPALLHIQAMEPRIGEFSHASRLSWQAKMTEWTATLAATRAMAEDYRRQMNRMTLGQQ